MSSKNVYIIAGPNGSGKTTFAERFLPDYAKCQHFINADMIAKGLSPFSPEGAALKAGRIVLEQVREYSRRGEDFAFETTLSGKTYLGILRDLKAHLFFLWVPAVNLTLARIRERVSRGGHDVPSVDVRRRFARSLSNFVRVYRPLLDSWMLFDNSTERPGLIARQEDAKLWVTDEKLYKEIFERSK